MADIQSNGHHHHHRPEMQYHSCELPPHVQSHPVHTTEHHNGLKEASPPVQHHPVHAMGNGLDAHVQNPHGEYDEASTPHVQHRHGNHACILAIARAVPPHKLVQSSYADFYFSVTNCQHKTQLKHKMARICERSGVETRHSIMTEEFLKEHPELYTPGVPSLEERHRILAEEVPRLASEAGQAAIREWGRPAHDITHLVVVTLSGVAMPGADVRLVQMLGLRPSVRRIMLYMLGCYAGVTALRVAKDLAENNPGSRVLICCSELSATTFRAPNESSPYNLVASALFGDGAVGLIVGAHPNVLSPPPLSPHSPLASSHVQYEGTSSDKSIIIDNAKSIQGTFTKSNNYHEHPTKSNATFNGKSTSNGTYHIISTSNNHHENSFYESSNPNYGTHNGICMSDNDHEHEKATNIGRDPYVKHTYISNFKEEVLPNSPPNYSTLSRSPNHDMFTFEHPPIYEMHTAIETIIPNTESIIEGNMKVEGLEFFLDRALPSIVADHVANFCEELLKDMPRKSSLREVFWAVHPGGPAVLDAVEQAAKLDGHHLQASRHILSKYGNVSASSVLFVLDEIRKTTISPEWGIAIAFGPGITFEGVLLRRVATNN